MLNLSLILAIVAGVVAVAALLKARSASTRLQRITESYWELRYESGQLKSRVGRLEVQAGFREPDPTPDAAPAPAKTTFVPLSSLRK